MMMTLMILVIRKIMIKIIIVMILHNTVLYFATLYARTYVPETYSKTSKDEYESYSASLVRSTPMCMRRHPPIHLGK